MKYYNLNGLISDKPSSKSFFVTQNLSNDFIFKEGDNLLSIENLCFKLRNELAVKIFEKIETFHYLNSCNIFPFAALAGIDAEIRISKEEFEKTYSQINDKETLNKLLYYYDVENLIGNIQNSIIESKHLVGEFYKVFNENSFLISDNHTTVDNGIQYASGTIVTGITSLVNQIFINLYSQLDFITKLIFEIENLSNDFAIYPKLKSKDILFGDSKKTQFHNLKDSIFELNSNLRLIVFLRNEIVHNASIDSIPKVYQIIENKIITEKFILLPDFEDGIIQKYKNRKRFFNKDTKLNLILPEIIIDFWRRVEFTLKSIEVK